MAEACIRCWVGGRVQGVSFRAAACARGRELGLQGYARNLPDGRVEVYACGGMQALEELRLWLREGPPQAHVNRLECAAAAREAVEGFSILY